MEKESHRMKLIERKQIKKGVAYDLIYIKIKTEKK